MQRFKPWSILISDPNRGYGGGGMGGGKMRGGEGGTSHEGRSKRGQGKTLLGENNQSYYFQVFVPNICLRVLATCERNWALNLATNVFKSCKVMVAGVQLIHMRYP